ncbi:MAG TPA: hypothetical protein VES64_01470 [Allosphingosinicella sp.]|nr:hypothetical protein [Allosphingosinicella sp.]
MTTQSWLWSADGAALAVVLVAGLAEWRRSRRRNLDNPGWTPWRGIQVAGLFAMLVLTVLAVRA